MLAHEQDALLEEAVLVPADDSPKELLAVAEMHRRDGVPWACPLEEEQRLAFLSVLHDDGQEGALRLWTGVGHSGTDPTGTEQRLHHVGCFLSAEDCEDYCSSEEDETMANKAGTGSKEELG